MRLAQMDTVIYLSIQHPYLQEYYMLSLWNYTIDLVTFSFQHLPLILQGDVSELLGPHPETRNDIELSKDIIVFKQPCLLFELLSFLSFKTNIFFVTK